MIKTLTLEEIQAIRTGFAPFRDSGCRLLLPDPAPTDILVQKISGHWFIAPADGSTLGCEFFPQYLANEMPLPHILRQPYRHCSETILHVGRETYIIYPTPETRDSEHSYMMKNSHMYAIDSNSMIKMDVAKVAR